MKRVRAFFLGFAEIITALSMLVLLLANKVSPESAPEINVVAAAALLVFGTIRFH